MSRFHLQLLRMDEPPEDLGRMDLPDVDAARAEALRVAQELRSELPADDVFSGISVEIAEEAGQRVLTVPISIGKPRERDRR
jgi:hypothetical protein